VGDLLKCCTMASLQHRHIAAKKMARYQELPVCLRTTDGGAQSQKMMASQLVRVHSAIPRCMGQGAASTLKRQHSYTLEYEVTWQS